MRALKIWHLYALAAFVAGFIVAHAVDVHDAQKRCTEEHTWAPEKAKN